MHYRILSIPHVEHYYMLLSYIEKQLNKVFEEIDTVIESLFNRIKNKINKAVNEVRIINVY
jgi:hypothetical protein